MKKSDLQFISADVERYATENVAESCYMQGDISDTLVSSSSVCFEIFVEIAA